MTTRLISMPFQVTRFARRRLTLLCLLALAAPAPAAVHEQTLNHAGRTLHLVYPQDAPKGLVLFLLGSAGWDEAARSRAREVANLAYLVVGIDWSHPAPTPPWWDLGSHLAHGLHWLDRRWAGQQDEPTDTACWDIGAELAETMRWLPARASLPKGSLPILLGQDEGAALVYTALLQSPPRRFHAALSLNFRPRWPATTPPCERAGWSAAQLEGDQLKPAPQVPAAWFLFEQNGSPDDSERAAAFIDGMGNARLASEAPLQAPKVPAEGRDPISDAEPLSPFLSLLQWLDPRLPDQVGVVSAQADTTGLPLTEVRAEHEDPTTFAIMLSGDGGWAALDRRVSATLAAQGISTVGWNALSYFWKPRSPDETAADLTRVLRHYLETWHKERVILIGYSFGAEVMPFMANGLPPELRSRVSLVALLGLGPTAMFEFHISDWLGGARGEQARPVRPQIEQLGWTRTLCIYGLEEENSLCPALQPLGVRVYGVPGDHHFDEDYAGVARLILRSLAP
ncbi:MAG: virulence factor family protein [Thermochromatium sp.]